MGSFIVQCFASKQVISEGVGCRVALLRQANTFHSVKASWSGKSHEVHGVCTLGVGIDALWRPSSGFLKAEYIDYGLFKLADTTENHSFLLEVFVNLWDDSIMVHAIQGDQLELAFDFRALVQEKAPVLFSALSTNKALLAGQKFDAFLFEEAAVLWDCLQEAMREGHVFEVDSVTGSLRPLSLAAVHESAFEELIAVAEGRTSYSGLSHEREAVVTRIFSTLADKLKDAPQEYHCYLTQEHLHNGLSTTLNTGLSRNVLWPLRGKLEQAVDKVVVHGAPIAVFLSDCEELLNQIQALTGLDYLNVAFTPVAYAGQDYENTVGQQYAQFVAKTSAKVQVGLDSQYA